jgi:hypothetical protein
VLSAHSHNKEDSKILYQLSNRMLLAFKEFQGLQFSSRTIQEIMTLQKMEKNPALFAW